MTETSVEMKVSARSPTCSATRRSSRRCSECYERLGPVPFDDIDRAFAAQIQATLTDGGHRRRLPAGRRAARSRPRCATRSCRCDSKRRPMIGSTDVGDVSWVVPTVQAHCATYAIGTPGHSWQLTAQGKTPAAKKGMVHVAKVMAGTAVRGDRGQDADRARQGRPGGTDERAPLYLPDPGRREAAPRHGGGMSQKAHLRSWRQSMRLARPCSRAPPSRCGLLLDRPRAPSR